MAAVTCTEQPAVPRGRRTERRMAEMHVARCDAPECGKTEPLKASSHSVTMTATGLMPVSVAQTFSLPDHWWRIDGATICSWTCLSRYAASQAESGRR